MSGRWSLFVDAGWLFAAGSTLAFERRVERRFLQWDPEEMVAGLVREAEALVPQGSELLRTYWYDGSPNRLPTPEQIPLAMISDVKLRLGRTARGGQKGVDGLIIHDLITHAYRRTLDDAVVLSGDEDLLDAIESAQANGTRVHLLEIPIGGVSHHLLRAIDRRAELDEEFFSERLHDLTPKVDEVDDGEVPEPVADGESVAPIERVGPAAPPLVRPAWMDAPAVVSTPVVDEDLDGVAEAGRQFAMSWLMGASSDSVMELLADRPYLANGLDAELLRFAADEHGWLSEGQRRVLRDAFWSTLANWAP